MNALISLPGKPITTPTNIQSMVIPIIRDVCYHDDDEEEDHDDDYEGEEKSRVS